MSNIQVNDDGSVTVARNREEIIVYYNQQIEQRLEGLVKLLALGGDTVSIKARINQINEEKKQKLLEVK